MSTTKSMQVASPVSSRLLTVDEFALTPEHGDNQMELIDGRIVRRDEMEPAHVGVTERTRRELEAVIPTNWFVGEDKPPRVPTWTEALHDIAVVRGDFRSYLVRHPEPADVALIIEVSDTSLARDGGEKWDNHAKAAIPIYWIINLVDRQVEVYSNPGSAGEASRLDFRLGDSIPVVVDGAQVGFLAVAAGFGRFGVDRGFSAKSADEAVWLGEK